ncbi:MAG TPA: hypothetical protein VMK42_19430 [Anaeromyxobacteraceae bacterium]|nr:hypothetical protein [Anaeromyxobacteraceae bacterium]
MRHLLTIAAALIALGALPARSAETAPTDTIAAYLKDVEGHLRTHQKYPATRAQLIAACHDLKDFSEAERTWFIDTLPDRTYPSADDVLAALRGTP